MTERYVAAPWWRFAIAIVALLFGPPLVAVTMAMAALGGLALLIAVFGAGGISAMLYGFMALIMALALVRVCCWIARGRKRMVRRQRIALGVFSLAIVAPALGLWHAHRWPGYPKAYWSVAIVYVLHGLWLIVDAIEDRWSV